MIARRSRPDGLQATLRVGCAVIAGLLAAGAAHTARAGEASGLPSYPLGVDTIYTAEFPPIPGLFLNAYALEYHAEDFKNASGHDAFDHFSLDIQATAARPIIVWPTKILGANLVSFATLSAGHIDASADVAVPGGLVHLHSDRAALLDWSVAPVILNWHRGAWSYDAGLEIYTPTGNYDKTRAFNLGKNYYTFYPQAAITWRPTPTIQASAKVMYGVSSRNDETRYQSGDHVIADFAAGVGLTKTAALDLSGFAYVQTTDDTQPGIAFDKGARSRLFGLGPQLRWNIGPGALAAKWQHEFGARNTPQGDRFYVQFGIPLYVPRPPAGPS